MHLFKAICIQPWTRDVTNKVAVQGLSNYSDNVTEAKQTGRTRQTIVQGADKGGETDYD